MFSFLKYTNLLNKKKTLKIWTSNEEHKMYKNL